MDRVVEPQSKESMRKMILLQEEVFKQQVQELHRVYDLQKKAMHELRQGLIRQKEPQTLLKQVRSSCSGEMSCVPIKFDLDSPRVDGAEDPRDVKRAVEETDVEVELTLGIGRCTRKRRSSQCVISTHGYGSDQLIRTAELRSSSLGTNKGGDLSSSIGGSIDFRDKKQPQ